LPTLNKKQTKKYRKKPHWGKEIIKKNPKNSKEKYPHLFSRNKVL